MILLVPSKFRPIRPKNIPARPITSEEFILDSNLVDCYAPSPLTIAVDRVGWHLILEYTGAVQI